MKMDESCQGLLRLFFFIAQKEKDELCLFSRVQTGVTLWFLLQSCSGVKS